MKMMFGGLPGAGSAAKDGRVVVETASRRPANADPMLRKLEVVVSVISALPFSLFG
jgi:hypothetical protein